MANEDNELITRLLEKYGASSKNSERRQEERLVYQFPQQVAFDDWEVVPPQSLFRSVHCENISRHGVSFFCDLEPPAGKLVLSLGEGDEQIYAKAEIRHVTKVQRQGKSKYLVGCAFTGWVRSAQPNHGGA